jgi:hypothetical protein
LWAFVLWGLEWLSEPLTQLQNPRATHSSGTSGARLSLTWAHQGSKGPQ